MVVDASIAIKWLVPEDDSAQASLLIALGGLIAPELIAAEIANAVWKKWHKGELLGVPPSLDRILGSLDLLEPIAPLARRATEIAIDLDHPAYDCFYLALAEANGCRLVTADARMVSKLRGTMFEATAVSLEDALQCPKP